MKYGIYYAYWEKEWAAEYTQYVKKAEKLGFDILEIGASPLPEYSQEKIQALRQCSKDCGVTLTAGYGPTFDHNMGSSDPAIREKAAEWFKRLFEVMGQLEISKIGGALYSYWPVDFSKPVHKEDDWKYSVEGMKKLSELAEPYQITLNLEVLNRFENHILNTAEEGVQFVTEVDRDNVKVMLDTFHMNIEETSISVAIRTAGKLLGHFHTGECNRMVPGQGRMPWREIAEALHEIQYHGSVVMEPFVRRGGQIEKDIHIWRNMKPDISEEILDRDARNALLFEKYLFEQ